MNEAEAKELCTQLAAEHPDRLTHRWAPLEGKDGKWSVVKINLPPTGTAIHATPEPGPDDPRIHPPWLNPPSGGFV